MFLYEKSQKRSRLTLWMNAALASIVLQLLFLPSEAYLVLVSTQRNTLLPCLWNKKRTGFQVSGLFFFPCKCLQNSIKWIAKQKLFENKWQKNCKQRQMTIKKFFCQINYTANFRLDSRKDDYFFLNYLPGSVLHAFFYHKVILWMCVCVYVRMQVRRQLCSNPSCHW